MFTDVSGVLAASIIIFVVVVVDLMMEVDSTYETSINVYQTARCNNPEDIRLHQ
jgi:hypothetical protein